MPNGTLKGYIAGGKQKSTKAKLRKKQSRLEKWQEQRAKGKLQARYDAAQTTTENRRHWANADDKTPTQANSPVVRQRLRVRATYEWQNNSICSGMISTRSTDIIGYTCPRPQVFTDNPDVNRLIEEEWQNWSESALVNLPEKLKILDEGKQVEGEHFLAMIRDSEAFDKTGYQLGITVLSSSRVTDGLRFGTGGLITEPGPLKDYYSDDGVIINPSTGRAAFYNVTSPYDTLDHVTSLTQSKTLIPARYVLHWFTPRRAGQFRGVSELTPSLPLFAQLRRYVLATLTAAETAAMLAGIMKTNSPVAEPAEVTDWTITELERGTLLSLPEGWDASQFKPEQPTASFEMFIYCLAREIGRAMNIPVGVVLGDSSRYNYSSARLDYCWYDEQLKFFRKQLVIRILDPLFNEWLNELAVIDPRVGAMFDTPSQIKREWQFARRPSIDPEKDAKASTERLTNGTSNLAIECANDGRNWEDVLAQRQVEQQRQGNTQQPTDTNVNPDALMAVIAKAMANKYPLEATAKLVQLAYPRVNMTIVRPMLECLYGSTLAV